MPDPLDTLRTAIAQAIFKRSRAEAITDGLGYVSTIPRAFYKCADDALAVLADSASDPVRLRAILELVGLEDVREGWLYRLTEPSPAIVRFDMPPNDLMSDGDVLVCRVRPQGEVDHAGS